MSKTSEFGEGFIYNLVLFAKHYEKLPEYKDSYRKSGLPVERAISLWFNGAGDHLFGLQIPKAWAKTAVGKLARKLVMDGLHYRLNNCSQKQFDEFWEDFERLTMLIDKKLGLKPIKADFN